MPSPSAPPAVAPNAPRGSAALVRRISSGSVIVVLSFFVQTTGIANVPLATADGSLTSLGIVLWLVSTAMWGTVFVRDRFPLVTLAGGVVLALMGVDYLVLLVAVHHLLVRGPAARAVPISLGATAAVALFVVRELVTGWGDHGVLASSFDGRDSSDTTALAVLVVVIALASLGTTFGSATLARSLRERDRQRRRADHEHVRAESLGEEVVRQGERERLARDIHDALAHRLSVISLQSGALEEGAAASHDPAVVRAAQTLREQAHQSLDDLRGLLGELRSEPQTPGERAATPPSLASMRQLGHLVRSVREGGAVVDAVILVEGAAQAGAALDRTVYRIVQESMTNALKHAPSSPVSVYVEAAPGEGVRIRVTNPLPAVRSSAAPGSGRGIVGIRERAQMLGGTAWIGETEGQFLVDVSLPWPAEG